MLILILRLPESPRWLVKRNDHDSARKVLERIRPPGADISGELQDIVEVEDLERKAGVNRGWHGLRQRWVRPAAWLFIWRRMPELTGRSLEQIEAQLHSGHFRPRDFKRKIAEPAATSTADPP